MTVPLEIKEGYFHSLKLSGIQKEKNLYRVFFDSGENFLCDEDDIFEYKLYKDSSIAKDVMELLIKKNDYYECLNDGIRLVNIKFYSAKQVKDRLLKKNYQEDDIREVIEYLKKIKAIDDEEFYRSFVEFKSNQGYGPIYIKNKLYELGIDKQVILSYEKQYELIKKQLSTRKSARLNKNVFIKKMRNKLVNQGFDLDIVDDVIDDIEIESNEDILKEEYEKLFNKYQDKYEEYQLKQFIKNKLLAKGYRVSEIEIIMEEEI